jgi:hypothetical protein
MSSASNEATFTLGNGLDMAPPEVRPIFAFNTRQAVLSVRYPWAFKHAIPTLNGRHC